MATDKKSSGLMFSLRPFISDSNKSISHVKDEGVTDFEVGDIVSILHPNTFQVVEVMGGGVYLVLNTKTGLKRTIDINVDRVTLQQRGLKPKADGMVPEDIKTDVLLPGFTDGDLLSYVSLNQGFISSNLKGWGLTVDEFGGESDAYIVSDILGCDVSILDGVDVQKISDLIQDFLLNDSDVLEDTTTTGDIGAFVPAAFGDKVAVGTHKPVSDAGSVGELKEGFSLRALENYIYANEAFIRRELKVQHLDVEDIPNIEDYFELSDILGCSSFVLSEVDLQAITNFIYGILDDSIEDSKEEVNLVDLLWTLRSAGVVYESRKAMGVSVDDYRAYVEDLIKENGLSDLAGTDVINDSVNIFIVTPELVQELEDITGFSIQEYTDKDITVSNQGDSYGGSGTVISTVGKTFDSVAKSILSMHIRDYHNSEDDPDQPFKALVLNDVQIAKRVHWSEEDMNSYLDNVLNRKQAPFFITNFSESTFLNESILEDSDDMQLFLSTNLDAIENFMGYIDNDPIDTVLKAYDLLFREYFSEY